MILQEFHISKQIISLFFYAPCISDRNSAHIVYQNDNLLPKVSEMSKSKFGIAGSRVLFLSPHFDLICLCLALFSGWFFLVWARWTLVFLDVNFSVSSESQIKSITILFSSHIKAHEGPQLALPELYVPHERNSVSWDMVLSVSCP